MVENPRPEDYGTEFRSLSSRQGGAGGFGKAVVVVLALAAFAALGWFGYGFLAPSMPAGEPPLIKADINPIKRRPADPGGIDPPHQDKTVYDQVSPGQSGEVVEKLLPPPETPVTPTDTGETPDSEAVAESAPPTEPEQVTGSEQAGDTEQAEVPEPTETPAEEETAAAGEETAAAEEAPSEPTQVGGAETAAEAAAESAEETPAAAEPEPTAEEPAAPAAEAMPAEEVPTQTVAVPQAKAPQATGGYRIQVAAMRSSEAAEKAWARLQKKHGEVLGGLEFFMQRVDLGEEKGVFFRVQGGPLPDRASAKDICAQLRERSVSCLVVKG